MSSTKNFVNTVHVGSGTNSGASTLATITKGDLFLVDASTMIPLTAAQASALTANDTVYIASGVGAVGEFKLSEKFKGSEVKLFNGTTYAAPVKQRTYVGYNEVAGSGSLPAVDETEYTMNIVIKDDQRVHGQKQTRELYNYETGVGATQAQTAFAIASLFGIRSLNGNYKQYNGRFVDMEVVGDAASQGVSDNAVSVVKGSKRIVFATAAEYDTAGYSVTVGDYLTFDNADGTIGHYQVEAVDGLIVTLDQPYAGETRTVAAGDSDYYLAAQAAAADYGFRITSQDVDWNGIDTYEIVAFDVAFFQSNDTDVASTSTAATVTTTAEPFMGAGYWQQVYDMEYFAQGYSGVNSRTRWYDAPALNPAFCVDQTGATTYNILNVTSEKGYNTDFQNRGSFPVSAQVAIPKLAATSTNGTQEHTAVDGTGHLNFARICENFFNGVLGLGEIDFG